MSNHKNTVSDSVKEQILLESDDPKCVITKLASKYGVTAGQIYHWRSVKKAQQQNSGAEIAADFVELVPSDSLEPPSPLALEYVQTELKFAEFSFSIEGKISSQKLYRIIELVSSAC